MTQPLPSLDTTLQCRLFIQHMELKGDYSRAQLARARNIELQAQTALPHLSATNTVEQKCLQALVAYEEAMASLKNRKKYTATRTRNSIKKYSIINAVDRLVSKPKVREGYAKLIEMGLPQYSFEQVVFDHPQSFSQKSHANAISRINQHTTNSKEGGQ